MPHHEEPLYSCIYLHPTTIDNFKSICKDKTACATITTLILLGQPRTRNPDRWPKENARFCTINGKPWPHFFTQPHKDDQRKNLRELLSVENVPLCAAYAELLDCVQKLKNVKNLCYADLVEIPGYNAISFSEIQT